MTKRDVKKLVKGNLVMDMDPEESFHGLCSPLPDTPTKSPILKKLCTNKDEKDTVSNSDILQAICELKQSFSVFEQQLSQNTADINQVKEVMKGLEFQTKETEDKVKMLDKRMDDLKEKTEDGERYSRRWNLRLINLPEKENEDLRQEVFKILSQIAPDEKSKMGFLVDVVHRVGRTREDNKPRPVIIQFNMRTFRMKIWRESRNADILKKMNLRFAEDLTRFEKECRNKLWPLVEQARKDGKKTRWQGPAVFIDGVKFTA